MAGSVVVSRSLRFEGVSPSTIADRDRTERVLADVDGLRESLPKVWLPGVWWSEWRPDTEAYTG